MLMLGLDPAMDVTGTPNPMPRPSSMSPARKRFHYVLSAGVLLGFGSFFGYAALTRMAPNPAWLPLAVMNALVGSWCLVKACRVSRNSSD